MPEADPDRLVRARASLEGLSVADALGNRFFGEPERVERLIALRALPAAPWRYSDDTEMALSIVTVLARHGEIDPHALAGSFAARYDPTRGYGPAMHDLLAQYRAGVSWRLAAPRLFGGQGSWGNGAAMRAGPLGAYFADDPDRVPEQAGRSAVVTHTHPEAAAGAIAVALAAAWAARLGAAGKRPTIPDFLDRVQAGVPHSDVRAGLRRARGLRPDAPVAEAVALLGNGRDISAPDTVPFALYCAARYLDDYEEALWYALSGLGDRDTTGAIAGSVVAAYTGAEGIPAEWRASREPLPAWAFD
jgi:ADP-ribosylglycohydrolase